MTPEPPTSASCSRHCVGTSEVVKQALDLLHKEQYEGQGAKTKALLASDFVGCADGAEDLSSRYKRHLTQALEEKHGPH